MVKKLDKWCDNLWIYFMCIAGGVTLIALAMNWSVWPLGAKGGAFCAIIMPLHVIEEWKLPGGLHYFYNTLLCPKHQVLGHTDRFPMSRLTDMCTNIGMQFIPLIYLFLSLTTNLSDSLAIGIMLFCFLEVVCHTFAGAACMVMFRKAGKRTVYNPGLVTSYVLFLPAGVYLARNLADMETGNWIGGIIALSLVLILSIPVPEMPLKKWVLRQEGDAFAFKSPKYFSKFVDKGRS